MWEAMGMRAIPVPVRERILKLYDQGRSTRDIASSFGYCVLGRVIEKVTGLPDAPPVADTP